MSDTKTNEINALIELGMSNNWNSFHRKQRNAVFFEKGGNILDVTFNQDQTIRTAEFNGATLPESVIDVLVPAILS